MTVKPPAIYLWDACGPRDRVRGVTTDGEAHARQVAEESARRAGARTVLVEQAYSALLAGTLEHGYQRTGEGWYGHIAHAGSPVAWETMQQARERAAARARR